MTISLPHAGHPAVSVVMVTYGGWDLTRRTLESVATHTETPAEVVIVDNPAGEDVAGRLRDEVHGAEVVLNDRNVGFGPAANLGVERARGTYVAFLNTDALVRPGWVETLVAALEADPLAGAAVPRFLNEDGTVQEAGGLLFRDGSTLMHGFGADPSDVAYRFRRYADYGSAACLLVRRSDFDAVGGFDPGYVPAYCEDVDLQLKLRERGLRTVFEPRSEVVHVRFGSTGLGEETAARLVEKNTAVLRRRWPHVLAHRPPPFDAPGHEARVLAARDADALERLLVVAEDALPERLLEAVRDRHPTGRVTLLGVRWRPAEGDLDRLLAAGVEVAPFEDPPAWLRARRFHHTAVLAPEGHPPPPIARALMVWQPQAPIITMGAGGAADVVTDLLDELTNVGIPPESTLREGHPSAIG